MPVQRTWSSSSPNRANCHVSTCARVRRASETSLRPRGFSLGVKRGASVQGSGKFHAYVEKLCEEIPLWPGDHTTMSPEVAP